MTETCAHVQPKLSDYLDGTLPVDDEAAVRLHLRVCADCAGVLTDLQHLVTAARAAGPVNPPEHVWLEIAGRIRLDQLPTPAARVAARVRTPVWQWALLSAALVLVTLGAYVWQTTARRAPPPGSAAATAPAEAPTGSIDTIAAELDLAQGHYARALAELMALAKADGTVDPAIVTTVEANLTAIDTAISESRAALLVNPESEPARDSLFDALRRKITVLQTTVSLINQIRQGDQAGAVRSAETLGKKS